MMVSVTLQSHTSHREEWKEKERLKMEEEDRKIREYAQYLMQREDEWAKQRQYKAVERENVINKVHPHSIRFDDRV